MDLDERAGRFRFLIRGRDGEFTARRARSPPLRAGLALITDKDLARRRLKPTRAASSLLTGRSSRPPGRGPLELVTRLVGRPGLTAAPGPGVFTTDSPAQ
jgi:hypothetical protein